MSSPDFFYVNHKEALLDLAMRTIAKCYRGDIPYSHDVRAMVDYVFENGHEKQIDFLKTLAYITQEMEKE